MWSMRLCLRTLFEVFVTQVNSTATWWQIPELQKEIAKTCMKTGKGLLFSFSFFIFFFPLTH